MDPCKDKRARGRHCEMEGRGVERRVESEEWSGEWRVQRRSESGVEIEGVGIGVESGLEGLPK